MRDLHELPKLRDSLSYLYVEHTIINQKQKAIELIDKRGRTMIPVSALSLLMIGPGTSITHAAIRTLADNGCLVVWSGEDGTRFYAQGMGETRKAYHLLRQAELACEPESRMRVVMNMYRWRFQDDLPPDLSLPQVRGHEGVRVREAYARASREYDVPWHGRRYDRSNWANSDPINRAISTANGLLNGLCHAAIVSGGYSPAIGFIHTGKQLSFVYDVADLYKVDITIPIAFQVIAESPNNLYKRVRAACREAFRQYKLLENILPDIDSILDISSDPAGYLADTDPALPEDLWAPLYEEDDTL